MHHHHRFAPLAAIFAAAAMAAQTPAAASAATAVAAFTNPVPGTIIIVAPNTSFTARWTELNGSAVTDRHVTVQSARPMGQLGCDTRWVPAGTAQVNGLTALATSLADGRCYRFVLAGQTAVGAFAATSAPIVVSTPAIGPAVGFTNPIKSGVTFYDPKNTVSWTESDTFSLGITSRTVVEEVATTTDGTCATATSWRSNGSIGAAAGAATRTLSRGNCYRYQVTLTDAGGFRRTWTSPAVLVAPRLPAWTGGVDVYRSTAFASQATGTWCVAASTQMMLNMILGTTDSSQTNQSTYISYAQAHDAWDYPVGSDPAGWKAALTRFGGGAYGVSTFSTRAAAVNTAAKRLRLTNKPVGILAAAGGHAWVMTGFTATADPAVTNTFTVTNVYVTGPLWPRPTNSYGYDLAPDTKLSMTQFAKYFTPYDDYHPTGWDGYYVIVNP